jgi:alcohol dehydrogenase class IV
MLPHVVRWNASCVGDRYDELMRTASRRRDQPPSPLSDHLYQLARAGGLPATLRELGVNESDLPALAADAATQWTGTFNPRPLDETAARLLYELAW